MRDAVRRRHMTRPPISVTEASLFPNVVTEYTTLITSYVAMVTYVLSTE